MTITDCGVCVVWAWNCSTGFLRGEIEGQRNSETDQDPGERERWMNILYDRVDGFTPA